MKKVKVKCRLCSAFLLSEKSIVSPDGDAYSCAGKEFLNSPQFCEGQIKTHLFLQVSSLPEWVTSAVTESLYTSGKITCPKCKGRLGSFNFHRQSCRCGCKKVNLSPVHLLRDRVDIMQLDFTTNAKAATPHSSCANCRAGLVRATGEISSSTECQEGNRNCLASFAELKGNPRSDDMMQKMDEKVCNKNQDLNVIASARTQRKMFTRAQADCDESWPCLSSLFHRDRDTIHTCCYEDSVEERPSQQPCVLCPDSYGVEKEHYLSRSQKTEASCRETDCACKQATCVESVVGHVGHRISDWNLYRQHALDDVHGQTLFEGTNEASCPHVIRKYSNATSCERHSLDDVHETQCLCHFYVNRYQRDSHDVEKTDSLCVQHRRSVQSPDSVDIAVQTIEKDIQTGLPIKQPLLCSKTSMRATPEVHKHNSFEVCKHHSLTPSHEKCHIFSGCSLNEVVLLNSHKGVAADGEDCWIPGCKDGEEPLEWAEENTKGETHSCQDIRQVRVPSPYRNCQQASSSERNSPVPNLQHSVQKTQRSSKKRTCSSDSDCSGLGSPHVCINNSLSSSGDIGLQPSAAPDDPGDMHCCETDVEERENRFQALQDIDPDCGACRVTKIASTRQVSTEKAVEMGYSKFLSAGNPAGGLTEWKTPVERMEETRAREVSVLETEEVLPEFTCAVCLEVMLSPHTTLPCRHDFCSSCLRRLAVSSPLGTKCPLCRETIVKCIPNSRLSKTIQKKYPVHVRARRRLEKRSFRNTPLPGSLFPQHLLQHLHSSQGVRARLGASRRKLMFLAFNILMVMMLSAVGMVICRHVLAFVEEALDTVMEKLTGEKLWSEFMGVESRIATVSTVFVLYLVSASMVRFFRLFRQIEN